MEFARTGPDLAMIETSHYREKMDLKNLKRHWEALAKFDPFFAILTDHRFRDNRWDANEFFRTGEAWIGELLYNLKGLGINVAGGRCLDFGCGVGRLTQALCGHFEICDGVDIAPSMIELARKYNRHGDRCHYHTNEADDLQLFPGRTFDFVCSLLVLQHIEPRYSKNYISEFIRVLKNGGIAAFQLPSVYLRPVERPTLPASAYRASIIPSSARLATVAAQPLTLDVTIRNESDVTWPEQPLHSEDFGRLRLGNHWLDERGNMLLENDGRTNLPQALAPGQEISVALTVIAPELEGRYLLEIDLVEEGVTWFAQRGVRAPRIEVSNRFPYSVRAGLRGRILRMLTGAPRELTPAQPGNPFMEIHCVPRAEVIEAVETAGGRVLHQLDNDWCGGGFDSILYVAMRRAR